MEDNKKLPTLKFKKEIYNWNSCSLKDICTIVKGQQLGKKEMLAEGKYYVLNGGINPSGFTDSFNTKENTISISEGGNSCGYVNLNTEKFWSGGHNYTLQDLKLDTVYLYQFLKYKEPQIMGLRVGSGLPNIQKSKLSKINVSYPNKSEQLCIGSLMSNIDNVINNQKNKLEKICNIRQSLINKFFIKNIEEDPKIKFTNKSIKWKNYSLSKIANMHARIGWQNLRTSEFLNDGKYLLITGTDFENGRVNYSTCHYVEKTRYEQDKNIQVKNGSILVTKDGTLGKVALVSKLTKPATLNAGVFNITINNENEVDVNYLYQYLKAPVLMNYVKKKGTGGTIKHLNQSILVDFPVNLPDINEQQKIGDFLNNIDNLIILYQEKINKLLLLKKAVAEKIFM